MTHDQKLAAMLRKRYVAAAKDGDQVILHAYFMWRNDGISEHGFIKYLVAARAGKGCKGAALIARTAR